MLPQRGAPFLFRMQRRFVALVIFGHDQLHVAEVTRPWSVGRDHTVRWVKCDGEAEVGNLVEPCSSRG